MTEPLVPCALCAGRGCERCGMTGEHEPELLSEKLAVLHDAATHLGRTIRDELLGNLATVGAIVLVLLFLVGLYGATFGWS